MPSLPDRAAFSLDGGSDEYILHGEGLVSGLIKRVKIPINTTTTPEQITEMMEDPWKLSGKYGLGWVYFGAILLLCATSFRLYNYWGDKIRTGLHKQEIINSAVEAPPQYDQHQLPTSKTDGSYRHFFPSDRSPSSNIDSPRRHFFPPTGPLVTETSKQVASINSIKPINNIIAFLRFIFYRPISTLEVWRVRISFPSPGVMVIVSIGLGFSMLYSFLPQPLFYSSMAYGSPPLAIRAGMLSVALLPWIVALASKVNLISYMTGIGSERLIVLHRWAAYICILLAILHAVPFWWQSMHDPAGFGYFRQYFHRQYYVFTSGIVALMPLLFLFFHSLPILRHKAYEVFAVLHVPVSWAFIILMLWHCNNYLTSWAYLFTTIGLLVVSLGGRFLFTNWSHPMRPSFMIGEESAVTILPENAIKITIPTQRRWRPGQYAYIRMPGIALLENHPFTIASLCSDDFPSNYGDQYRDMTLVFRPFGGFTRKVFDAAMLKGPYKTYRAFVEGPYGGMERQMSSFDQVIFFAGGSGITAIASQLVDLIKRMRDAKAITTTVHVIWAMKRPEIMEWFREELRICREFAPAGSVHCNFYITAARRSQIFSTSRSDTQVNRLSRSLGEKLDDALQGVASKRNSRLMENADVKEELEDELTALPQTHLAPPKFTSTRMPYFPPPPVASTKASGRKDKFHDNHASTLSAFYAELETGDAIREQVQPPPPVERKKEGPSLRDERIDPLDFAFDFPDKPATFEQHPHGMPAYSPPACPPQPTPHQLRDGWRTEYGRPDIPLMLKRLSKDFGKRTCVFVCGPPEMRVDVARTVAELQRTVWQHSDRDELFLHTENYSI